MLFFKNKKDKKIKIEKYTLSENAVKFIKKYAIPELNIVTPIDEETIYTITDLATKWEIDMIDPLSVDGCDKNYNYPERERNELADKFVGEITGQWDGDANTLDFKDLNERLGLI